MANYATIRSLNAVNAKFKNLDASNITSGKLSADRIDTKSFTSERGVVITGLSRQVLDYMMPNGQSGMISVITGLDVKWADILISD